MQYHWKQRNSTAQETKYVFAINLKAAYFKHKRKNALFCDTNLKLAQIRCKQTK